VCHLAGTQDSVRSDDEGEDDGASLRDFVVDEDGENATQSGSGREQQQQQGHGSMDDSLLHDLTNLSVTEAPSSQHGDRRPKPTTGQKAARTKKPKKKTEKESWTLSRVATAVRESGRALGPRSDVSIAAGEWSRQRKRLTTEIFEDLNAR
jgi:hypothetical protein